MTMRRRLFLPLMIAVAAIAQAGSEHPYYRRRMPKPQNEADCHSNVSWQIDFAKAYVAPYPEAPGDLTAYNELFDARTAAALCAAVAPLDKIRIYPNVKWLPVFEGSPVTAPHKVEDDGTVRPWFGGDMSADPDLLELKYFGAAGPSVYLPWSKCLNVMAYPDYFPDSKYATDKPDDPNNIRQMVSAAILEKRTGAGWCGTFGPGIDNALDVAFGDNPEGNYDMTEMHLLHLVYRYYDELSEDAREKLLRELLTKGRVHRPGLDETYTSGSTPPDWNHAGHTPGKDIGENENHILMIVTARYLTNQLLYHRDHHWSHDNRRNGGRGPHTAGLLLSQMRDILRDDFSEYNAKNYQEETRWALLNLATYAYDPEVRLAARMALDYVSAHIAVSSNDLRRMVPFRRKNEKEKVARTKDDFMTVGLLDLSLGCDPMVRYYAIQTGQTRALESINKKPYPNDNPKNQAARPWPWSLADNGNEVTMEAYSDYRLPPLIHDLFVNDTHRRFFQRLHRIPRNDEQAESRNCDNVEIYASSPSYLISAGSRPCPFAINPYFAGKPRGDYQQQKGVAVTTSFIPT